MYTGWPACTNSPLWAFFFTTTPFTGLRSVNRPSRNRSSCNSASASRTRAFLASRSASSISRLGVSAAWRSSRSACSSRLRACSSAALCCSMRIRTSRLSSTAMIWPGSTASPSSLGSAVILPGTSVLMVTMSALTRASSVVM